MDWSSVVLRPVREADVLTRATFPHDNMMKTAKDELRALKAKQIKDAQAARAAAKLVGQQTLEARKRARVTSGL